MGCSCCASHFVAVYCCKTKGPVRGLILLVGVRGFEPPTPASRRPVQKAKPLIFGQRSPVFQAALPSKPTKTRFDRFIEPKSTVYMRVNPTVPLTDAAFSACGPGWPQSSNATWGHERVRLRRRQPIHPADPEKAPLLETRPVVCPFLL